MSTHPDMKGFSVCRRQIPWSFATLVDKSNKNVNPMPVHNINIANQLNELADLLEIEGENPFKIRAYRNAARAIEEMPLNVESLLKSGKELPHIQGIGESITNKIKEIVFTGHLSKLEEIQQTLPGQLAELVTLPSLGPKRVKTLHDQLGIQNVEDLQHAVEAHQVQTLAGFGVKTEEKIRHELETRLTTQKRIKWAIAEQIATPLLTFLQQVNGVKTATIAGSYRRHLETVGDIDILVTPVKNNASLMTKLLTYDDIQEILSQGDTRSTVILKSGLQVDIRVISEESYGAALVYFTGSKTHNIAIRSIAQKKRLKINEYGVFDGEKRVAGKTESDVYQSISLRFIEPELRENRGEIEAAQNGTLPHLVTLEDIQGDLHAHTLASDGRDSIEAMAFAAKERGYAYIAITDHTKHTSIARGLDETRMKEHIKAIDKANREISGLYILRSAEVDILEDGSLDLPDSLLKALDLRICSIHSHFNLSREKQTERVLRAMDNPYFNIFTHPTGRLLSGRPPYDIDMEQVMTAALERGCFLELDGQPDRLDLNDTYCRMAKERGLKLSISSDAHTVNGLGNMRYGVYQARRGWLEPNDVINTLNWPALERLLKRA